MVIRRGRKTASGMPKSGENGLPKFESDVIKRAKAMKLGTNKFEMVDDPAANERCKLWILASQKLASI